MCKGRFVFLYAAQVFKGVRRIVTYDSMHCSDEKKKNTQLEQVFNFQCVHHSYYPILKTYLVQMLQ